MPLGRPRPPQRASGSSGSYRRGRSRSQSGQYRGSLDPLARGRAVEQAWENLPSNFPTIDRFANGVATSIKSIDLNAATYQDAAALTSKVNGYVDSVAGFNGRVLANRTINAADVTVRQLQLAVPPGGMSAAQQAVIRAATTRAQGMGVQVIVTPYP